MGTEIHELQWWTIVVGLSQEEQNYGGCLANWKLKIKAIQQNNVLTPLMPPLLQ